MIITPIKTKTDAGNGIIARLLNRFQQTDSNCIKMVTDILAAVRERGDEAIFEYTRKFDAPNFQ